MPSNYFECCPCVNPMDSVPEALSNIVKCNKKQDVEIAKKVNENDLSVVAKSGRYGDLIDKPVALPNPKPITINGQRYDGSEAVTVTTVEIDDTLTQSGKAADAKAVGDQLSALNEANAKQDTRLTTLEKSVAAIPGSETSLQTFIDNTDIDYEFDEASDANYTVVRVYKNKLDGTKQYPFVYAPNGAEAGAQTPIDVAKASGWLMTLNAGLFDTTNFKPDGIIIQDSTAVQNSESATYANCLPLTIDANGDLGYAAADADANNLIANGVVSAVCGFCPIIIDYASADESITFPTVSHFTTNAQRQIIGQFSNGDYAIITCEGRGNANSDGWTIAEAQTICKKLGLRFAYNLDGGGSADTIIGLKHLNSETGRKTPTLIVFNGTTVPPTYSGDVDDVVYYTVTRNLVGCSSSSTVSKVEDGAALTETVTATNGYTLNGATVSVTMGGTDITGDAYADGVVSIASVTGDIVITVTAMASEEEPVTYSVTNSLTNVSTNNSASSIESGAAYSATLTADDGYTLVGGAVAVTMGGVDVTSSVYAGGNITIPSVTGNVVIAATANKNVESEPVGGITWVKGIYPHSSISIRTNAKAISAFMPDGNDVFKNYNSVDYYLIPIPANASHVEINVPYSLSVASWQNDYWTCTNGTWTYGGSGQRFKNNSDDFETGAWDYLSVVMILSVDATSTDTSDFTVVFS